MHLHNRAFYFIVFFLGGVAVQTMLPQSMHGIVVLFAIALLTGAVFYLWNKKVLAMLAGIIILGGLYAQGYEMRNSGFTIPYDIPVEMTGVIQDIAYARENQTVIVEVDGAYRGKIYAKIPRYPEMKYGDKVILTGTVLVPEGGFAGYLKKDGVYGVGTRVSVVRIREHEGNAIKEKLFRIKHASEQVLSRALPVEHAAFVSGLLFGETAAMSKEFKDALKRTGTTHLIALSGYNITIIAGGILFIAGFFLKRKWRFIVAITAITLFVIMTGAAASVVRAAIMGGILLLANVVDRPYSLRNTLAVSAFVMVAQNPFILVYDIGFQLSFLAVFGIAYLAPRLETFLRFKEESGFLHWRENLLNTIAAQAAVFPLLLLRFDFVSLTSVITNMLVLPIIPITMFFGFLMLCASIFSLYFAQAIGLITHIFSGYAITIIEFTSSFSFGISVNSIGILLAVALIAGIIGVHYIKKNIWRVIKG
ncbi:MAG: ComEC/Rec2 family competence protein [Patescibacteria group bacterium]